MSNDICECGCSPAEHKAPGVIHATDCACTLSPFGALQSHARRVLKLEMRGEAIAHLREMVRDAKTRWRDGVYMGDDWFAINSVAAAYRAIGVLPGAKERKP